MDNRDFFQRVRLAGNPLAHHEATVVRREVRFTVLTSRLIRLEWSPSGVFTDNATFAFPHRYQEEPPPFEVHEDGEFLRIETGALSLSYRLGSGQMTAENLTITFSVADEERSWQPGQASTGNLGGTRRTLDETGGDVPFEPGLVSRDGWAVFDDSQGVVFSSDDGWVEARPALSLQDWYFFGYGHAYADALKEYTRFGGNVPLIPRYVLGIWWSRYWHYSDKDLEHLVSEFADHGLPLDVLVVDMDWHTPGHWTGYSWNHDLFPDPEAFLASMHQRGLRVTLNLHPADGVHAHETAYPEFAAAMGMDAEQGEPIPFRIANREFAERYFALLHHPLEEQGTDFWWIDWQQGESTEIAGLDPLIWLNHLHFTDAQRREQRPLLFSRWGGLGNHRYPLGFSGDTYGGWATLASLPRFTANAANVGFGWWSHDIGGHFGAVEPELFVRWLQFGILSPCLRLHSTKDPLGERRPWAFTAPVLDAARQAFALRYRLSPYLYTMARRAADDDLALCRPMYYAYPEHDEAYEAHGQYALGDDLIAAPITQPADPVTGKVSYDVWVPPGAWYHIGTGETLVGPRWVRLSGNLTTIPLFARAGSIVPLAQPALHLDEIPTDYLELRIFPGNDGTFRLYEDDGASNAYLQGAAEWTTFTSTADGEGTRVIEIGAVEGHCPTLSTQRSYTLTFIAVDRPEQISDEHGADLDWLYEETSRQLRVQLPMAPKVERRTVTACWQVAATTVAMTITPPFAHVTMDTAGDDQAAQMGHLILVPPYTADGQPQACSARIIWQQINHYGIREIIQSFAEVRQETKVEVPFALDAMMQPQHWSVEARLIAGEHHINDVVNGPYLFPAIQRWRTRYAAQDEWDVSQPEKRANLADPYTAELDPKRATSAEATTTIELSERTILYLDTWTSGALSLVVDGVKQEDGEPRQTLAGLTRHWPVERYGSIDLEAGTHQVSLALTAPESGQWLFGVLLVDAHGVPLMSVTTD